MRAKKNDPAINLAAPDKLPHVVLRLVIDTPSCIGRSHAKHVKMLADINGMDTRENEQILMT